MILQVLQAQYQSPASDKGDVVSSSDGKDTGDTKPGGESDTWPDVR